jgi:hypothetical protein
VEDLRERSGIALRTLRCFGSGHTLATEWIRPASTVLEDRIEPPCACGCGAPLPRQRHHLVRYLEGHQPKPPARTRLPGMRRVTYPPPSPRACLACGGVFTPSKWFPFQVYCQTRRCYLERARKRTAERRKTAPAPAAPTAPPEKK